MQLRYLRKKEKYTRYRAKNIFFFLGSFGLDGLKHFINQDDRNVIKKILFGTEKMTRTDSRITLCNIWFNLNAYKNLSIGAFSVQLVISFILFKLLAASSNCIIL